MRLLKGVIFFSLLMMIVASCAPQGSLTPRSAFYDLRAAFQQSDAAAFERLLSQASYRKIRHITALFSRLNDRQHESLSALYKIPQERLQKLSVREYLKILLAMDRGRDVIGAAVSQRIVGINREGNRAVIRVENGMELAFVKEGPYWKIDLTEL
ncbi:MAG: hypothetical protein A2W19_14175 [Spirochaetes bacterium RBG_16_49_21]|nr:MAG: hypothetical protein A2W19_14175 [Spirochaetes bacterium RBG_16_49_21]